MEEINWDELAVLHGLDSLEGKEKRTLKKHLATGDSDCQKLILETFDFIATFAQLIPQKEPPPNVRERLLDKIEGNISERKKIKPPAVPIKPKKEKAPSRPFPLKIVLRVFLVLFAVAIIFDYSYSRFKVNSAKDFLTSSGLQLDRRNTLLGLLFEPQTRFASVTGLDPSPEAKGLLVWNFKDRLGYLLTSDLPRPDRSSVYKLWAYDESGARFIHEIDINVDGESFTKIESLPSDFRFKKFAVTLEYALHSNDKPIGNIYLMGDVNR